MRAGGFRVHVDDRIEKMGYKIREAQVQKVPYMFVVGKVEEADADVELVSVRHRHAGDLGAGRRRSASGSGKSAPRGGARRVRGRAADPARRWSL